MSSISHTTTKAQRRANRVRAHMHGTATKPRVSVHRTNRYIAIQAIDDTAGKTIASAHDMTIRRTDTKKQTKTQTAVTATEALVQQLKKAKVAELIFDRGSYRYHGRVKAVAEHLREQGMKV